MYAYPIGKIQHIWKCIDKALQIEMDEYYPLNAIDRSIEEQFEIMQKSIWEMSLKGNDV